MLGFTGYAVGFAANHGKAFVDHRLVIAEKYQAIAHKGICLSAILRCPNEVFSIVLVGGFKNDFAPIGFVNELAEFVFGKAQSLIVPGVRFGDGDKSGLEIQY